MSYSGELIWNVLPEYIKVSNNIMVFYNRYIKWMKSKLLLGLLFFDILFYISKYFQPIFIDVFFPTTLVNFVLV